MCTEEEIAYEQSEGWYRNEIKQPKGILVNTKDCNSWKVKNNTIQPQEWYSYLSNLLKCDTLPENKELLSILDDHDKFDCVNCELCEPLELNCVISDEEIYKCLSDMKSSKSPGIDGISINIIKDIKHILVPILTVIFNQILDTGIFPEKWTTAVISPLHKQGAKDCVNNYRGISSLPVIGKLFAKVLNSRLNNCCTNEKKLAENQAGFRKHYSTIDNPKKEVDSIVYL